MMIPAPHFWKRAQSGQALLMATTIVLLLFLGVITVVFVHQVGVRHQTASHIQAQGQGIAEEGIAYAGRSLSNLQSTWTNALQNTFPPGIGIATPDCNSGNLVQGTQFKITCDSFNTAGALTRHPGLQPYQIAVTATAVIPQANGQVVDGASVQTILSEKTLGAFLSTGKRADAALQLLQVPLIISPGAVPTPLTVHWGPVICLDVNPWTLANPMDQNPQTNPFTIGYPRKFSAGGITGVIPNTRAPNSTYALTDQKEYWAFAAMSFPPIVNRSYYYGLPAAAPIGAENENDMPAPVAATGGPGPWPATIKQVSQGVFPAAGSGHYSVPSGVTANFDNTFVVPGGPGPHIIYIDGPGNVIFTNLKMDLGTNGALIVAVGGTVTLNTNPFSSGLATTLNIPMTAPQEYAYWPAASAAQWPCKSQCTTIPGATTCTPITAAPYYPTCTTAQAGTPINFRGFLWVRNNLIVQGIAPSVLDGVVLIGDMAILTPPGQLQIAAGSALTIFYDANVNQNIQMSPG